MPQGREKLFISTTKVIGTTEGLRHNNRALILNALRESGPMAHTQLSEKTGLASGTISAISGEFLEEGVLTKVEQSSVTGRGRPRISFAPNPDFANIVLVRIAAGSVEYSLIDYASGLKDRLVKERVPEQKDAPLFGQEILTNLSELVSRSGLRKRDIHVISISSKGEIDSKSNTLNWSPVLSDQKIDFNLLLADTWEGMVQLNNETALAAHDLMLEARQNDQAEPGDYCAVLSLSDSSSLGIAHITHDGEIEAHAPAFGHMPHLPDGPLCRCGALGCLESIAGFYGILRTAFDGPTNTPPATFVPIDQMLAVADTARKGDRKTAFAFRQAGAALGMGLARMFTVLGPMPVTVTGPGLPFFDLLQEGMMGELEKSFSYRIGHRPDIRFETSEETRAFKSNIFLGLREFDNAQVATRQFSRG